MKVNIKKLKENAIIPSYAKAQDAGLDLTCISREYDTEKRYWIYHTGLAVEIPEGHVGLLFPRSSIRNTPFRLSNSVGVVDSGYRGELVATFKIDEGDRPYNSLHRYSDGERVVQLLIIPYPKIEFVEVEELSDSERGTTGFGSSNKSASYDKTTDLSMIQTPIN